MEETLRWFEALYDTYGEAIFRHLYWRLGDRERAKELTQDVFMRAWQYVSAGQTITHEKAWLYRAAHNAFVNEIRTNKATTSLDTLMDEHGFDISDSDSNSAGEAEHTELLKYLDMLKDSYRTVIIMRYIDGLPIVEIAKLLDERETTISMRLERALEKLRSHYTASPRNHEKN